jgi:5-formyltetrahydrofolate cyclo-ligase
VASEWFPKPFFYTFVLMTKAEIRKEAAGLRKALTDAELHQRSLMLLEQFKKLDLSRMQTIHIFLPISEKKEPDTFLIIEWLKQNHPTIKVIVPKADFNSLLMTHHVFSGHEDLQKNVFNILEPQEAVSHSGDIDLVIVPLLAFDLQGYRVGYGKGFYDRFLEGISTIKLGLSLFEPVPVISDADVHDIPLDSCITPSNRYDFSHVLTR